MIGSGQGHLVENAIEKQKQDIISSMECNR
jgi:hypothetical protein